MIAHAHVHLNRAVRLLPLAALFAAGGCFATRNDVRVVQADLASFRTEQLKANADQREALNAASRTLAAANDSLRSLMNSRFIAVQGDVRGGLRDVATQLLEVQELLKQSTSRINDFRTQMEQRANQAPIPVLPPGSTMDSTGATPMAPVTGPNELLANGRAQQAKGSWSTAREIYQEILTNYPTFDRASDAQLYLALTFEGEKNQVGALTAYAVVVQKYPDSPAAPTSLYKRAFILRDQGKVAEAKTLLQQIVSRYPNSTEYSIAAESLKTWK
ncbi:MAG: tetratricopeptide repeat protein [Gemmatimonas sp.]